MRTATVIGAGAAGSIHARLLAERGYTVCIYDADAGHAAKLAARVQGTATQSPLHEADITVVAVPTQHHYQYIRLLLDEGRTVVSEKPLCLYPEQAVEVAGTSDGRLYIAESQGYGADQAAQREQVRGGYYGDEVLWRVAAMSPYKSQAWSYDLWQGGGAFLEGGVHVATVARMLFGKAVNWQGMFRCLAGGSGPDTGQLAIEYEDGDMLSLQICWGTAGCWSGACKPLPNVAGLVGSVRCAPWWPGDNHAAMWDALLPAIEAGTQPLVTADDAAGAVADVWRCYRAGGYGDAKYIDVG